MSKIDFQNGFALGLASGGIVESEGVKLNLAYGETPPEDTSKLWIKAKESANVSVGSDIEGVGSVANVGSLLNHCDGIGCARVGNKIYLLGGYEGGYSNKIYAFDLETETLTALSTTLPTVCYNVDCATVGKKIYLFGGYCGGSATHLNTINVFDTETETITTLSVTLPKKTIDMGCASVGTKIYLFGGMYYSSGYYDLNTIIVFDTETETLTTLGVTLPKRNYGMACVSVDTKIYLLGGRSRNNGAWTTIDVFDTETQTITTLNTTLPTFWYDMGCSTIGTKIYLFGGYDNSNYLNTIGVFDTETETIEILENTLPIGCQNIGCSAYGNKVYLFGGYNNGIRLNTINCFTLTHELAKGDIEIQSGLLNNKFNLINTDNAKVQIGVENVFIGDKNNEAETSNAFLYINGEWVQISFGRDQFAPEEPTGTYAERMYEHFGVDSTEYPYLLIDAYGTLSNIYFFTGRDADENGNYHFTTARSTQITIDEGSDISAIIGKYESTDSSTLLAAVNNLDSNELDGYTYYANFDYAELGYSGLGTWETLEQGGDSDG